MQETIEALERQIEQLRTAVRQALIQGDRGQARTLRAELRTAERAWDAALAHLEASAAQGDQPPEGVEGERPRAADNAPPPEPTATAGDAGTSPAASGLLPLREQVHQALTLLTVPAAPRLITAVHEAFFTVPIVAARLTSLRRDEERSFRAAPYARPYYICAALTADLLAPARGLLAVSTWPLERRVIGPLSPRVDFLTAAIQVAESVERIPTPGPAALRLLWRFAANIPGAAQRAEAVDPRAVAEAARAEKQIHAEADSKTRRSAALRARRQLDDAQQLFGSRLHASPQAGTA